MKDRFGSLVLLMLLVAGGTGIVWVPTKGDNADFVPNPEMRAMLELRGAAFDAIPGAVRQDNTAMPVSPILERACPLSLVKPSERPSS
jgi:hypothetical protein